MLSQRRWDTYGGQKDVSLSLSLVRKEQSQGHILLNHADTSGFCKGVHSCEYQVNRKLAFGTKTEGITKFSK
jgi:hypothetical protein